jgi:hypothetical protein
LQPWKAGGPDGLPFPLVAVTTTFNPRDIPSVSAKLVVAEWAPQCANAETYAACVVCWGLAKPMSNYDDMANSIMLLKLYAKSSRCYTSGFQYAMLASRAGSKGLLIATDAVFGIYGMVSGNNRRLFFSVCPIGGR